MTFSQVNLDDPYFSVSYFNVLAIVLCVILQCFGHCDVCHSSMFWPLCCVSFFNVLAIVMSVILQCFGHCVVCHSSKEWHTSQWPKHWRMTHNTMAKTSKNDTHHNGQNIEEWHTTQWPKHWRMTHVLAIVMCVILRFTDSDYLFGIFKLFLAIYDETLHFLPKQSTK
jgi:hypothetical protein